MEMESNWPDLCQHGEWLGDLSESLCLLKQTSVILWVNNCLGLEKSPREPKKTILKIQLLN